MRSGRPGGVVIEFFGMPGVGKTTLARHLAEDLCASGYRAQFVTMDSAPDLNRYIKLAHHLVEIAPYLMQHPREAWRAVALLRLFPPPGLPAAVSRLRYWWRTGARAEHSASMTDITILDQGFLLGLFSWALDCARFDPAAVPAALKVTPRPQILVIVSAPKETVRTRLRQRNYHHRQIDQQLLADHRRFTEAFNILSSIERALPGTDCHVVRLCSAPQDPAATTLTQEILAVLPEHLATRAPHRD